MKPEDFATNAPGDVEQVGGTFSFRPDPLPPSLEPSHDRAALHGDAMYAIGRLADLDVWLDSPEIVLSPLIHREATESSNIETTTRVTLSDLYRREAGGSPGGTDTEREDVLEATNYVRAISSGIDRLDDGEELSIGLLCDLHEILLSGGVRGEAKRPGELRDELVGLGEPGTPLDRARFVPAPPPTIPYALENLLQFVRSGTTYAPLVDLALVHYQFETIHPFEDGNGRLGRLLVMLVLFAWDLVPGPYLYPSSYFNANRDAYLDLLFAVSRDGAWEEWITFFLEALAEQGAEAYAVARELIALRDEYRDRYRGDGPVLRELLDLVVEQPYFTEPQAVDALDRSQPAINAAIRRLWDDGVLEETTGNARNRRYRAIDVLEIVEPRP